MEMSEELMGALMWMSNLTAIGVVVFVFLGRISRRSFVFGWCAILLFVLVSLAFFMSDLYTGRGITEATWYHLSAGMRGLSWRQVSPLVGLFSFSLISFVIVFLLSWHFGIHKHNKLTRPPCQRVFLIILCCLALMLHPGSIQVGSMIFSLVHKGEYRKSLDAESISVLPEKVMSNPRAKSVVYIYLESMEGTFLNNASLPDIAPHLASLKKDSLSLDRIVQAPFTGWTIAGIAASQCGTPAITGREASSEMVCLGDILKHKGYELSFINAADLDFAYKGDFFRAHGFDSVKGRKEISMIAPSLKTNEWGVYDEDLFSIVEKEFDRLNSLGKPFFLSALTIDTHPPHGYASLSCKKSSPYLHGNSAMLNAIHCSDREVVSFVKRLEKKSNGDVIFVLASDHLQHDNTDASAWVKNKDRVNLWMAWGGGVEPQSITRAGTMFDVAPTLLSLMGLDVPALNLGRDLRREPPSMVEKFGESGFFSRIRSVFSIGRDGFWKRDHEPAPQPSD